MKKVSLFLILSFLGFISCDNTDDDSSFFSKAVIQFDSTHLRFNENGVEQLIRLSLNKPALQSGSVQINVDTDQASRFTTQPAAVGGAIQLPVAKGQTFAMLKVIPVDNVVSDGNLDVELALVNATEGLQLGGRATLSVTLEDNDTAIPFETTASFVVAEGKMTESTQQGQSFVIQFGKALEAAGSVELTLASAEALYNTHYTTTPAAVNGKIVLQPALGAQNVSVVINPVDNSIFNGDLDVTLTISGTSGSIKAGGNLTQLVSITDDELENMPKGYAIGAGLWSLKKTYEYDELGRTSKVHIESATPGTNNHTETFFYDALGRIERINSYPEIDKVFHWTDGRISKSQNIEFGIVKQYTEYDYDAMGNVSGTATYYKQLDGTYKMGLFIMNLYFTDGNIFKTMVYSPVDNTEELALVSTTTYDGYINSENPFPMVEILPNLKTQTKLPTSYRIESGGQDILYRLTYEFDEEGLVSKRHATYGSQVETAAYFYY
jgi:hypothetical protein